jgi:hypothetical protein
MNQRAMIDGDRLLQRVVSLCSAETQNPPGNEVRVARLLAEELCALGFDVALHEVFPDRPNLVATLANGPGPRFAFNTHLDVVPAGVGWTTPPFSPVVRDGRLFGRGACDAKGSLAAMVEAAAALAADRSAWSGTLICAFAVLILASSVQNVPRDRIDAARLLGASNLRIFRTVMLPLTMPGIVASAILVLSLSVSSYLIPILIGAQRVPVVPMAIFSYGTEQMNWPMGAALAFVLLVSVALITYGFSLLAGRLTRRGKWDVV